MHAPLPPDEEKRLQTLTRYDMLDTPPDAALDRLTALAARLFNVPIALVSLVDRDRQWFKSRHGLEICETHRDQSFCAHAILPGIDGPLVVTDTTLDPRFADNPLVTGPLGIRFYAGAPLRMSNGAALGSLCIIDTVPRELSTADRATLLDLAAMAVATLELHASRQLARDQVAERLMVEEALRRSEGRLRRMAANTPGMLFQFVLNPDGSFYFPFVGEGCREFYGVEPQAIYDRPELVLDVLEPKNREFFLASIHESARTLGRWDTCGPYRAPDGSRRWMEGFSQPEAISSGKILWHGMILDITKRKHAEWEAKKAAQRVRIVLESIGEAFFCLDHDWRFTYVNEHAAKLLGRGYDKLSGKLFWEEMPSARANGFGAAYRRAMETGEPVHLEDFSPRLQTWVEVHAYPSDEGLSIYFRDIADRKKAEADADDAARRVRTVLESISDAFYSLDREWRFTYVNDQAEKQLESRREDLLGQAIWTVLPRKAETEYYPRFHRAVETGEPEEFQVFSAASNQWFDVHAYPSEEGLSVYTQEITERVQAQRQIEDSHKLLKAIIDGTDNHIFIKDRESRYLLMNPAAAAMLGTTPEEVAGKGDEAFFPPASVRGNRESDLRVMTTGEIQTYESSDIIAGVEHVFLSTKGPYRDAAGNLLGVIGISREITGQRRAAEALRAAKEEAEKANAAKSEFLSRMSHELRTPLNAILGFGQLLEISDLGDRPAEGVNHILKAGRHLLGLIDEVLSISRIEAGAMNLSMEAVGLAEITAECIHLVSRAAADRRVTCENRCVADGGMDKGVHVQADRQRLRQVLLNLLSNAVKYNRQGGRVTLDCRVLDPGEDGEPRLRLEVTDTGAGLTAEQIGRLFTPFERLGAERSTTEGTGLGLALSKGLIEAMGGRIGVDSVPGEGSTFWLELGRARHPLGAMDHGAGAGKAGATEDDSLGTVLYVEDNASNLRLIEMVLDETPGIKLFSAQQGLLGLEIARARQPDLILLDLHLPDIPGWEVLTMLQDDPATRDIPTVVISADATPGRIERLRAAGARDYLTKPIDVPKLMSVLRQYLRPGMRTDKPAAAASLALAEAP